MSRNGVARTLPAFRMRIRPTCSTMKSRPEPSPASVMKTGLLSPLATFVNLNEPLLALGPLGVARPGDGVGVGAAGEGEVASVELGVVCEVGLDVEHPTVVRTSRAKTA